jgi:tetratricopeptide (TPR) repeat protein
MGDLVGATKDYETALRIDPTDPDAFRSLREIYSMSGDPRALYHLLSRRAEALDEPEECKHLLLIMAQVAMTQLSDPELAVRCHEQVLSLDPTHLQSCRVLAQLFSRRKEWKRAIRALNSVLELTQDERVRRHTLEQVATIYDRQLSDPANAIDAYSALLEYDSEGTASLRRLAELLHQAERWEPAARTYGRLLQREHNRDRLVADLQALAGICTHGLGDNEKAVQCLQQALRLNNLHLESHRSLVGLLRDTGETKRASAEVASASARFTAALLRDLGSSVAVENLFEVAGWTEHEDPQLVVAAVADALGHSSSVGTDALRRLEEAPRTTTRQIPFDLTDTIIPADVNLALLKLLRFANPIFRKLVGPSMRQLGCSRRTRLSPKDKSAVGIAARWPRVFGLPLEVHAVPGTIHPHAWRTDKQAVLVIDEIDVERIADADPLFLFELGNAIAPMSMGVDAWVNADELHVPLVAALIRHFSPTFLVEDELSADPRVDESRLGKMLAKHDYSTVMGISLELSGSMDGAAIQSQRQEFRRAFHRLGLIPIRDPRRVLTHLKRTDESDFRDALSYLLSARLASIRMSLFNPTGDVED